MTITAEEQFQIEQNARQALLKHFVTSTEELFALASKADKEAATRHVEVIQQLQSLLASSMRRLRSIDADILTEVCHQAWVLDAINKIVQRPTG